MARSEDVQIILRLKDQASKGLRAIQQNIVGIGAAYLSWRAVTGILKSITDAAIESQKVWTDVEAALRRHNEAMGDALVHIQKFASGMQKISGVSDEVIGQSIARFVDYGMSVDKAMMTVKTALDMSSATGQDYMSVVELLAKAHEGYTATLARYGIMLDESIPKEEKFAAAIEKINEKFGGATIARMDTYAVKLSAFKESIGDIAEIVGATFLPVLTDILQPIADLTNAIGGGGGSTEVTWKDVESKKALTESLRGLIEEYKSGKISIIEFRTLLSEMEAGTLPQLAASYDFQKKQLEDTLAKTREGTKEYARFEQQLLDLNNSLGQYVQLQNWVKLNQNMTNEAHAKASEEVNKLKGEIESIISPTQQLNLTTIQTAETYNKLATEIQNLPNIVEPAIDTSEAKVQELGLAYYGAFESLKRESEEANQQAAQDTLEFASIAGNAMSSMVDGMVTAMRGGEADVKRIFMQMFQDFLKYFIIKAIGATTAQFVTPFLGLLALFDRPTNDRMAMDQGRRYAMFFTQGATEGFGRQQPALAMATQSVGYGGTRLVTLSDELVRRSDRGENRLQTKAFLQTGISNAIIT